MYHSSGGRFGGGGRGGKELHKFHTLENGELDLFYQLVSYTSSQFWLVSAESREGHIEVEPMTCHLCPVAKDTGL